MTLRTLTDFDAFYRLLERSFPDSERRGREGQLALFNDPAYRVDAVYNSDTLQGFFALWEFDSFLFIEHFAVDPSVRGGGIGSEMLRTLLISTRKPVVLEVEPPEEDMARRRIGFYRRGGFILTDHPYLQPPMEPGKPTLPLRLMTSVPLSFEALEAIKNTLYARVYRWSPAK